MIRADSSIEAQEEITIRDDDYKIFAGLYEDNSIKCSKLNATIGYGTLELTEQDMIDIDGKSWSKETIKEALRNHLKD